MGAWRLSPVSASRGYSLVAMCGFLIPVASLAAEHGFWGAGVSVVAAWALVAKTNGLSSRGAQAWLLHSTSDRPGPEAKLPSYALQGRRLNHWTPGKSSPLS